MMISYCHNERDFPQNLQHSRSLNTFVQIHTILLSSTREIVIETLISPIFDMLDEPFHYVLQFSIVYTYDGLTLTIYKLRYTNVHRQSISVSYHIYP